jgi:transcriptional regulator with XRE-family HTH domain
VTESFPLSSDGVSTSEAALDIPRWTVGDRLRKARTVRGISVAEMAADIGRSVRSIHNYETDATPASLHVARRYALRTRTPLSWLLTGRPPSDVPPDTPATECYPGLEAA